MQTIQVVILLIAVDLSTVPKDTQIVLWTVDQVSDGVVHFGGISKREMRKLLIHYMSARSINSAKL